MIILAIGAHPDDIDFTAGGTVARMVSNGASVHYCLVTNGQAGGQDSSMSRLAQAKQRRDEQTAAGNALGISSSTHLDMADGLVEPSLELRRLLTRTIRTVKPDIVIAPSPRYNLDNVHFLHPDHLATGAATLSAVYPDSRNKFAFPELGLDAHTVKQVWLVEDPEPDYFVEISDYFELKLSALQQHSSQFATAEDLKSKVLSSATRTASLSDADLVHAEGFRRIVYEEIDLSS